MQNNEQAAASRVDLQQHQQQLQLLLKLVRASTEESRELRAALQQQAGAAAAEAALMAEFQVDCVPVAVYLKLLAYDRLLKAPVMALCQVWSNVCTSCD